MKKLATQLAAASALALLGTGAQAAIIGASLGSETIATFVNAAGDSVSFDTGDKNPQIGDMYVLPTNVLDFISAAGGLANVQFGLIAGNTVSRSYLTTSSIDLTESQLGNSFRNGYASALNQFIQDLNSSVPVSPAAQNDSYGPFVTGSGSPNYLDAGYDTWQTGSFEWSNLGAADSPLTLFNIQFASGSSFLGFANIGARPGAAIVDLAGGKINIVPVPAAVWLFASGLGLLGVARRKALA
jgi:hypothetical protein